MNNFGEFLYSLRKEKGMTQAELADALGVTNKAVSKWETGEAMPETSLLLPISRIFGVTVDELLDGKRAEAHRDSDERHNEGDSKEYIKEHLFSRGKDDEPKTLKKYAVLYAQPCSCLALQHILRLPDLLIFGIHTGLLFLQPRSSARFSE